MSRTLKVLRISVTSQSYKSVVSEQFLIHKSVISCNKTRYYLESAVMNILFLHSS